MADWTREENEFIVARYVELLEQELAHQPTRKSVVNRRVQDATGRGRGAVEYKFQNVSAVLYELRAPWVEGYKPAFNYQADLAQVVEDYLARHPEVLHLMKDRMEDRAAPRLDVSWGVVEPPVFTEFAGRTRQAPVLHTDYARLEASNRSLGLAGEQLIVQREQQRLQEAGRPDLAERVEHVSKTIGDGLGYDISSFTPLGEPRLIEVKSTRRGKAWPMIVSRNEIRVSRSRPDDYVLARVFDFAKPVVGLYELPGPIDQSCLLEPETYRAIPRAA